MTTANRLFKGKEARDNVVEVLYSPTNASLKFFSEVLAPNSQLRVTPKEGDRVKITKYATDPIMFSARFDQFYCDFIPEDLDAFEEIKK